MLRPFHLAIPVKDLASSRNFYAYTLGLKEGRSSENWIDFDFYGHQLVIHETGSNTLSNHNPVEDHQVPIPHFGIVLAWKDFFDLSEKLKNKNINFEIKPHIRFKGKPGEQATMFFYDPSGNAIEFKAFKNDNQLFTT